MNVFFFRQLQACLIFTLGIFLCAACKPKEKPASPAPPSTNEVIAPVATESPTQSNEPPPSAALPSGVIRPEDAKNYIGQTVTVKGTVDRVYVSQKGDVFIDMGGKHPNAAFTAVCFKQAIPTVQLQQLNGKIISVKGKIKEYQGKVEIVLESADQISQ